MSLYQLKSSENCNNKELALIKDFFAWQDLALESTRDTGAVLTATRGRHGCVLYRKGKFVAYGFLSIINHILSEGLIKCGDDCGGMQQLLQSQRPPDPECAEVLEKHLWEFA